MDSEESKTEIQIYARKTVSKIRTPGEKAETVQRDKTFREEEKAKTERHTQKEPDHHCLILCLDKHVLSVQE